MVGAACVNFLSTMLYLKIIKKKRNNRIEKLMVKRLDRIKKENDEKDEKKGK